MTIENWTADDLRRHPAGLIELLTVCVESGASMGFLPPMTASEGRAWCSAVANGLAAGSCRLLVAVEEGVTVGSVQLLLAEQKNGQHRAEVAKLLVHPNARGRGIARALMAAVEAVALEARRFLLVLRICAGDPAETLYCQLGWTEAGRIPDYARSADGSLRETVIFYKRLLGA
jgi:GNAT superfamily N-acetyltransferase